MKTEDIDFSGVLPKDSEERKDYLKRGEKFLEDAYNLKENLKKDARGVMRQSGIFRKRRYQFYKSVKDEPCRFVDGENGFFLSAYKTYPDWVSVVEADCINLDGIKEDVHYNKSKIPIAVVDSKYRTVNMASENIMKLYELSEINENKGLQTIMNLNEKFRTIKRHETVHCIRDTFFKNYYSNASLHLPWRRFESSPEENLTNGLTDEEWNHGYLEKDKNTSWLFLNPAFQSIPMSIGFAYTGHDTLSRLVGSLGLYSAAVALKSYNSYKNTVPTKIAFERILTSEEDIFEKNDVQYSLLRLAPFEIREIGKNMEKNNIKSGKTAIKEFLGKRKNLRSEIILENIS